MNRIQKNKLGEQESLYTELETGLNQILEFERGKKVSGIRKQKIVVADLPRYHGKEIKIIREKLRMTQSVFSGVMGVSQKTVEAWENGRNKPQGPAQRMLLILDKEASIVKRLRLVQSERVKRTG